MLESRSERPQRTFSCTDTIVVSAGFLYSLPMVSTTSYISNSVSLFRVFLIKHVGYAYVGNDNALNATEIMHAECELKIDSRKMHVP